MTPTTLDKGMRVLRTAALTCLFCAKCVAEPTNLVLNLDGSSYATIQNSGNLQSNSNLTVEAWINPISGGSVINKSDGLDGASQRTYELKWSGGMLRFAVYFALPVTGTQPGFAEIATPLESGVWAHVTCVYDATSGLKLYTNGVLASALTTYDGNSFLGLKIRQTTLPMVFGATPPFSNTLFHGSVDEVRFWSVSRSEDEIRANQFSRLLGAEPGLLAYWNFDKGTVSDLTPSSRTASITGNLVVARIADPDVIHLFMRFQTGSLVSGRFKTTLQSTAQLPLGVEVSDDLITWEPFVSITSPGAFDFTDAPVKNLARRFYRAISP